MNGDPQPETKSSVPTQATIDHPNDQGGPQVAALAPGLPFATGFSLRELVATVQAEINKRSVNLGVAIEMLARRIAIDMLESKEFTDRLMTWHRAYKPPSLKSDLFREKVMEIAWPEIPVPQRDDLIDVIRQAQHHPESIIERAFLESSALQMKIVEVVREAESPVAVKDVEEEIIDIDEDANVMSLADRHFLESQAFAAQVQKVVSRIPRPTRATDDEDTGA